MKLGSPKIQGLDKAIAALKEVGETTPKALGRAIYNDLQDAMTQSKEDCPVDTGNLRSTGTVDAPQVDMGGKKVTVEIGYGGPAADYAVYVHEDLTKRHPVGKAKFLEDVLTARSNGMGDRLAADIRAEYGL